MASKEMQRQTCVGSCTVSSISGWNLEGVFISTDFAEGRAGQEFIDSELRMTLEELELDGVIKFHWGRRESAQGEERWIVVQKIGTDR